MPRSNIHGVARHSSCRLLRGEPNRGSSGRQLCMQLHLLATRSAGSCGQPDRKEKFIACPSPHLPCRLFNLTGPLFGLNQLQGGATSGAAGWVSPLQVT